MNFILIKKIHYYRRDLKMISLQKKTNQLIQKAANTQKGQKEMIKTQNKIETTLTPPKPSPTIPTKTLTPFPIPSKTITPSTIPTKTTTPFPIPTKTTTIPTTVSSSKNTLIPPPPPQQPKKYSLQQNHFNNDNYFEIFCNNNTGGYRIFEKQRFDTNQQDIISNSKVENLQGCISKCNEDKTCTSFHYKKKMNQGDVSNCTTFRSYPTSLKSDGNYQSQIKNQLTYNYQNLTSSQKKNVQKYCVENYYQNQFPNKKIKLQSCFKNISVKGNKNYIDLDSQCVWNQIQSADMGKTKSLMTFEKNTSIQNPKKNNFLEKYVQNWNEYKENKHKYQNIERDLEKYDPSFSDYYNTLGNDIQELKEKKDQTAEGTLATSALLKIQKDLTIGTDLKIESFENQKCVSCDDQKDLIINIMLVLIICIFVYYLFLRK